MEAITAPVSPIYSPTQLTYCVSGLETLAGHNHGLCPYRHQGFPGEAEVSLCYNDTSHAHCPGRVCKGCWELSGPLAGLEVCTVEEVWSKAWQRGRDDLWDKLGTWKRTGRRCSEADDSRTWAQSLDNWGLRLELGMKGLQESGRTSMPWTKGATQWVQDSEKPSA